MVLAPFGPEVTVDPSGPAQNSGMLNPPSALIRASERIRYG